MPVRYRDKSGTASAHWSKDYVEHLRTVHFSLIAVCLGLIVLASSPGSGEITIARRQIRQIREVIAALPATWVQQQVLQQIHAHERDPKPPIPPGLPAIPDKASISLSCQDGTKDTFDFTVSKPLWVLQEPQNTHFLYAFVPPSTLQAFKAMWDSLNSPDFLIHVPLAFRSVALIRRQNSYIKCQYQLFPYQNTGQSPLSDNKPARPVVQLSAREFEPTQLPSVITAIGLSSIRHEPSPGPYYIGEMIQVPDSSGAPNDTYGLAVPVASDASIPFDGQSVLMKLGDGTWNHGELAYSFRQLNQVTHDFQDYPLDVVERFVQKQLDDSNPSFEAFGLKLPATPTIRFGLLLVLSIQLYFWVHLRQLRNKLQPSDAGWDVAWIGIYADSVSRSIAFATIFVLPVATAVALGIRGLFEGSFSWPYWLPLILGSCTATLLGFIVWKHLPAKYSEFRSEIISPDDSPEIPERQGFE